MSTGGRLRKAGEGQSELLSSQVVSSILPVFLEASCVGQAVHAPSPMSHSEEKEVCQKTGTSQGLWVLGCGYFSVPWGLCSGLHPFPSRTHAGQVPQLWCLGSGLELEV